MKIEVPESGSPDTAWIASIIDITKETLQNHLSWQKTGDNEFTAPVDQGQLVLTVGTPSTVGYAGLVGAVVGAIALGGVGSLIGAGVAASQMATRLILRQRDGSMITFRSGPAISALVQAVRLSPAVSEGPVGLGSAHN